MSRVRTNIEIENDYVQAIMQRYHLRTKTEAVDLALRKAAGEPMTLEEALVSRDRETLTCRTAVTWIDVLDSGQANSITRH